MLTVPRRLSDVDPAWMTGALARACPGIVVRELRIGPIEHGTNSRARIALTTEGAGGPTSVFVKGPGRRAHRLALLALGAIATEARFADARIALPLEHPVFYAGGVDWRRAACVVVAEDVVARGAKPNDARTPFTVDAVRSGLLGLAAMHGAYWDRQVPPSFGNLGPWRLGPVLGAVSVASLLRGMRRAERLSSVPPLLPPGAGAVALGRQFRCAAAIAASGPRTLLHGDPHPGNTYTTTDGQTGFYDWQLARLGHWSHDVGYFLVSALDADERRRHERELLSDYLDGLARAGVPRPSFESAWERYRATPAFGLATWLHTLSFGSLQPVDVCTTTIRRFATAYVDLETARSDVTTWR